MPSIIETFLPDGGQPELAYVADLAIFVVFLALVVTLLLRWRKRPVERRPSAPPSPRPVRPLDPAHDFGGIFGTGRPDFGPPPPPASLEPEENVLRVEVSPDAPAADESEEPDR